MHQRRIIREAVADHLAANAPAFGGIPANAETATPADITNARVYKSREAPANVMTLLADGPIANVYGRSDTIKAEDYPKSGFDSGVKRTLELAVEVTAVGPWTVDDKLDDLTDSIEDLLEVFDIPGLPSAEIRLTSTEIDSTDEFEQPLGGALMLYEISYWRPYRTDTSEEDKICHAFALGPDQIPAEVGDCGEECVGGPVE